MTQYRKVNNCGPVPYPDGSHRYLTDQVVSGDEWIPLIALGFIEEVEPQVMPPIATEVATVVVTEVKSLPRTEYKVVQPSVRAKKQNSGNKLSKNVIISEDIKASTAKVINAEASDRRGTKEMDNQETGRVADNDPTAPEGSSIR